MLCKFSIYRSPPSRLTLSRRERQIMDIIYLGRGSVGDVMKDCREPAIPRARPTTRARSCGHLRQEHGLRYVYVPKVPRRVVRQSALRAVDTFEGSAGR
jgi:hypothetical protein